MVAVFHRQARGIARDGEPGHVVALGNAWATGAYAWTSAQREAFANDENHLGVTAGERAAMKTVLNGGIVYTADTPDDVTATATALPASPDWQGKSCRAGEPPGEPAISRSVTQPRSSRRSAR